MANPNLELLQGMAHAMGPLCDQVWCYEGSPISPNFKGP